MRGSAPIALANDVDIDIELFAHVGQLVDVTDAQRQHTDDRQLAELGFLGAHHEQVFELGTERAKQRFDRQYRGFVVATENQRTGIADTAQRLALGYVFGKIGDNLFLARFEQALQLIAGADAEVALVDDQQRTVVLVRELADNFAGFVEFTRVHAQNVSLDAERGAVLCESHALVLEFTADQVAQPGFVTDTAAHQGNRVLDLAVADEINFVTGFGKRTGGRPGGEFVSPHGNLHASGSCFLSMCLSSPLVELSSSSVCAGSCASGPSSVVAICLPSSTPH